MQQWEYRTIVCPLDILLASPTGDASDEQEINQWRFDLVKAGEAGWEMVGVVSDQHRGLALCFFKRPAQ